MKVDEQATLSGQSRRGGPLTRASNCIVYSRTFDNRVFLGLVRHTSQADRVELLDCCRAPSLLPHDVFYKNQIGAKLRGRRVFFLRCACTQICARSGFARVSARNGHSDSQNKVVCLDRTRQPISGQKCLFACHEQQPSNASAVGAGSSSLPSAGERPWGLSQRSAMRVYQSSSTLTLPPNSHSQA